MGVVVVVVEMVIVATMMNDVGGAAIAIVAECKIAVNNAGKKRSLHMK
jgi:hypothetical protein